jgi:filamentous hemagglutinin
MQDGYTITGGGGIASEEYIPGTGPGTLGGTYVDITAVSPGGNTVRVQTVTTQGDGVTPTASEQAAAQRIQSAYPSDTLVLIPKGATQAQVNQAIQNALQ